MTPQQKQKIREDFEKAYGEMPDNFDRVHPNYIADYFLSILDKELEEERKLMETNIIEMIVKNSTGLDTISGQRFLRLDINRFEEDLIHNKS